MAEFAYRLALFPLMHNKPINNINGIWRAGGSEPRYWMGAGGVSKNLESGSTLMVSPAIDRREFACQQFYIGCPDKTDALLKQLQIEIKELKKQTGQT